MSKVVVLLLVLLAVVMPSAGVAEQPIQVFLLAGQSNMVGRAKPIAGGTGPTSRLLQFRDGSWKPAADPLGSTGGANGVGPGMTFGVGVLAHSPPGTTVGLVMCAQTATPISDWKPGAPLYNACKDKAKAAGGVVAGVVFLQGEREALDEDGGNKWASEFAKVEPGFQKDFGPVPFVLGQIGKLEGRPYQQDVRNAQAAAATKYPEVTLVTSTDLPVSDGVHFTLSAAKTLGTRYADAWYALSVQFPSLTGISPGSGASGASVTITGKGLGSVRSVNFGRSGAPASFTVNSPTQITAIVPDTGVTGPIRVETPRGAVSSPTFAVVPTVGSFSPSSGPPGTKLVVSGKAFLGATAVTLNGVSVELKSVSATQLLFKVPDKATTGKIAVTTAGGTAQSAGSFTVTKKS